MRKEFEAVLASKAPILALAPMQDVTDLPFWGLMTRYGVADLYFTEYFRVHATSNLEKHILKSIIENPTGRRRATGFSAKRSRKRPRVTNSSIETALLEKASFAV